MNPKNKPNLIHLKLDPGIPEISCWNSMYEMFYVIEGTAMIQSDGFEYKLNSSDLLVVKPYTLHRIRSYTGHLASMLLDYKGYCTETGADPMLVFSCSPNSGLNRKAYDNLQQAVTYYIYHSISNAPTSMQLADSAQSLIFSLLITDFSIADSISVPSASSESIIENAVRYMSSHYKMPITISSIAKACSVSETYLAHLFRKSVGIPPSELLTRIRLENSLSLLLQKQPLTVVAEESGFPSLRRYNAAFYNVYQIMPREYRHANSSSPVSSDITTSIQRLINRYEGPEDRIFFRQAVNLNLSGKSDTDILPVPHIRLLQCGFAASILNPSQKEEISAFQKDFGFTDIFLSFILDDHILRYIIDADKIIWDFSNLDDIIDFVLSLNLNPFLNLNSIPDILSPYEGALRFGFSNCSIPRDYLQWEKLLNDMFLHFNQRYGEDVLANWHVCVWTLTEQALDDDSEKLFSFITDSCNLIRSICPGIQITGPNIEMSQNRKQLENLEKYLKFCTKHNFLQDFLLFFTAARTPDETDSEEWDYYQIDHSAHYYEILVNEIQNRLKRIAGKNIPLFFSTLPGSALPMDYLNDTVFMAASHLSVLARVSTYALFFGGLVLKDRNIQSSAGNQQFCGGIGMETRDQIPKAVYFAEYLFQRLHGNLICKDENFMVSADENTIQILAFNPINYKYRMRRRKIRGNAFSSIVNSEMIKAYSDDPLLPDPLTRNNLPERTSVNIKIKLTELENGIYERKDYILNQKYGSSFDHWILMGGTEPDNDDISYLRKTVCPLQRKLFITVTEKKMMVENVLAPGEVRLIELSLQPCPK